MNSTVKTQQGLTLIELLISLLIGTILILAITQVFIDNRNNYLFQQGQSDNNENARYTLLVFEEEIRRTGYRISPDIPFDQSFRPVTSGSCVFARGQTITFDGTSNRLCLRYQPHLPSTLACDGVVQTGPSEPYSTGSSVPEVIVRIEVINNQIQCNGIPITADLAEFQLEFGISNNESRESDEFKLTPTASDNIQSIRYAALLRSRSSNLTDSTTSSAYATWHKVRNGVDGVEAPDRALYLMTESTINLRNLSR
ncbi:PilW family protein [Halopseudomonas yangmingensis]|uniref:Type IV pilus assembly protein PilW n=1 Tax=Halopseudomonas yangmingensis TaxID=1720063 RepID=A0A1I4NZW5_9GAMM|nr:prepilin-type N-terminal cleavage/methylation domain-containing protein [Halopseudomonas yangmingensis]SFM21009.1 type IV pilus assembly protein PilW [Halopseudomonas yangmingensis]